MVYIMVKMLNSNIFHSEITPECARYRTPIDGLYLCGSGTHQGGGVVGAPGYNDAKALMTDWTNQP